MRHERERTLAKRTTVREVDHRLGIGANVVHVDDDLIHVARAAFQRPETRVLAVVDREERLVGVLPVLRVVEEVVVRAAPELLMADVTDFESAARFGREIGAARCGDLMLPPVSLRPESTIGDAFRAMKEYRLSGLPIVDEQRHVIGYIDLLELALRYLADVTGSEPPPPPPSGG